MSRINVMQVVNSFTRHGAELLAMDLATELKKNGFTSSVCSLVDPRNEMEQKLRDELRESGVDTFSVTKKPHTKSIQPIVAMRKFISRKNVHIVHTHCPSPDVYGRAAGLLAGDPILVNTFHSTRYRYQAINNLLSRFTNAHVAISHAVEDWVVKQLRIAPRNVQVIHNGIDMSRFLAPRRTSRAELAGTLGIDPAYPIIMCVGRLAEPKGQEYLVRAAADLHADGSRSEVVLVGDGDQWERLSRLAEHLGILNRCHFLGARDDVPELLKMADVFVMPSLWEGFGVALIEAMAAGLPVLASDIDGIKEIVWNGETGYLVPTKSPRALSQSIRYLLDHPDEAAQMGHRAQADVTKRFSVDQMARQYGDLYQRLVAG